MTTPSGVGANAAEPVSRTAARLLQLATIATLGLALIGLAGGRVGTVAGTAGVVIVIAAPLVRVAWLAARWWRSGDRRYALIALALLGVVFGGAAVAIVAI